MGASGAQRREPLCAEQVRQGYIEDRTVIRRGRKSPDDNLRNVAYVFLACFSVFGPVLT